MGKTRKLPRADERNAKMPAAQAFPTILRSKNKWENNSRKWKTRQKKWEDSQYF